MAEHLLFSSFFSLFVWSHAVNRKQLLLSAAVCAALKITVGAPAMA